MTYRFHLLPFALLTAFSYLIGCSETAETPKRTAKTKHPMSFPHAVGGMGTAVSVSAQVLDFFETPEAAFAEYQKAMKNDDYERASQILTSESRNAVAGTMVYELSIAMANGDKQANDIEKLLSRYRPDDESEPPANPDESETMAGTMRAMGSTVKNASAFIGAAIEITDHSPVVKLLPQGELSQLEIGPHSAAAFVVAESPGNSTVDSALSDTAASFVSSADEDTPDVTNSQAVVEQPSTTNEPQKIEFRKIHGGWWVHLPDDLFEQ